MFKRHHDNILPPLVKQVCANLKKTVNYKKNVNFNDHNTCKDLKMAPHQTSSPQLLNKFLLKAFHTRITKIDQKIKLLFETVLTMISGLSALIDNYYCENKFVLRLCHRENRPESSKLPLISSVTTIASSLDSESRSSIPWRPFSVCAWIRSSFNRVKTSNNRG